MALTKARELRQRMTDAELLLWRRLRSRQVLGCKFRRQHQIGPFIVDFVCLEKKLVVEVDGSQHLENSSYDNSRTHFLEERSYCVARFWNHDVLLHTEYVLDRIAEYLESPSPQPSP